ncbi:hypothetical protein BDW62DRAFT_156351 [Aspergillus aurantiobrunneus]
MSVPLSTAATPRSSNLTVPATQNTAPVIKFRCLFTHDMRRKAKRWQDGFLRYHTFNKRVMVYDNTGYFIGDLHWRAPEGIQDGDEVELDKGVLIQVCEPLERTETDISSLYKNKNQISPSCPGNAPPSAVRSAAPRSSLSQQASRSLNDLLGIRKTSTPQLSSPYEQRHGQRHASTQHLHERPSKRQRTSPERVTRPSRQQDIVDLSDSPPRRPQSLSTDACSDPASRPQIQRTATLQAPKSPAHSSSTAEKEVQAPSSRSAAPSAPQSLKSVSSATESSMNALRLPSDKPRRKLLYQESPLAPVKKSETKTQLSQTNSQRHPTIKNNSSSSPIIVLDDDDPVLNPQPVIPHIARPAIVDSESSLSMTRPNNENAKDGLTSKAPIAKSSETECPPIYLSNNTIPTPRSDIRLPPDRHNSKTPENAKPRSTGLRKSFSDPTAVNSLHTRHLPQTNPLNASADNQDEQGPWTSEAQDLFDFWPPGRPKPN